MPNYSRLNYEDRIKIETYILEAFSVSEIAERMGRNKSTISREIARFPRTYQALKAHYFSSHRQRFRRKWQSKIDSFPALRKIILLKLKRRWSPEQISLYLKKTYADDKRMQVSHETIYTYIYVLSRGELKAELISHLRQKKKMRRRSRKVQRGSMRTNDENLISIVERPKCVESRSIPGDWEGDLLIGKDHKSALGTLVERKTRSLILVPLGSDYRPTTVRRAFEKAVKNLPKHLRSSLTYDRGFEMREHKLFTKNTKMKVYFCDPASPWQRGTCENTNGLIRDYFPKGTDFAKIPRREIRRVQNELNERPRKAIGFQTPKEAFNNEILSLR